MGVAQIGQKLLTFGWSSVCYQIRMCNVICLYIFPIELSYFYIDYVIITVELYSHPLYIPMHGTVKHRLKRLKALAKSKLSKLIHGVGIPQLSAVRNATRSFALIRSDTLTSLLSAVIYSGRNIC